jgi:tetratricopeptide (TPR) repeat protein
MGWHDFFLQFCPACGPRLDLIAEYVPKNATEWFNLVTQVIGVLWILYQFNKLREDTEAKLQEYLKKHLEKKRANASAEREAMLKRLSSSGREGLIAWMRLIGARLTCAAYFIGRFIPFAARPSHERLALTLFAAGRRQKARDEFNDSGEELLRQAILYEDEARAKRIAAGNAYLFAGRLSAMVDDNEGARAAFKKMRDESDKNDLDAIEQITEQYLVMNSLIPAGEECSKLISLTKRLGVKRRLPAFYRLESRILMAQSSDVRARRSLDVAITIDKGAGNSLGVAESCAMLGDIHVSIGNRNAASRKLDAAIDNYVVVRQKLDALDNVPRHVETWLSRICLRIGKFMQMKAEQYRVPMQTLPT